MTIRDAAEISTVIRANNAKIAITTVPRIGPAGHQRLSRRRRQSHTEFCPHPRGRTTDVKVLNIDMTNELARLSYFLTSPARKTAISSR